MTKSGLRSDYATVGLRESPGCAGQNSSGDTVIGVPLRWIPEPLSQTNP